MPRQTTTFADHDIKCGFCKKDIKTGEEIGFGYIKHGILINTVPICLSCFDQWAREEAGVAYDA